MRFFLIGVVPILALQIVFLGVQVARMEHSRVFLWLGVTAAFSFVLLDILELSEKKS